jgi:trimeric autotransporter adhesin
MNRSSCRCGRVAGLLIPLVLALTWLTLAPKAWAQCPQTCDALFSNTAFGIEALSNTTGGGNTANGAYALHSNTTSDGNTAIGNRALFSNTTGAFNTANGEAALYSNTTANYNTANGAYALLSNTTGRINVAIGLNALYNNSIGSNNTAVGVNALVSSTGSNNVGLGVNAGHNLTTGSGNVFIGAGVLGVAGESNTTRIRNIYASVASARAVYVNSDLKIGTLASTRRVKDNIRPMDKASEAVLALKPVSFRYKKEIDASGTPQFGLIAEDVAKINADLVTRDSEGKPETVRYEAINAMLLNEFLKDHKAFLQEREKVEKLEATIAQEQKNMEVLSAHLKEQDLRIQRISAQIEINRAGPGVVTNDSQKVESNTISQ